MTQRNTGRKAVVLVVEDSAVELKRYLGCLREFQFEGLGASSLEAAQRIVRSTHIDVVLTDLHLGDDERVEGMDLIRSVSEENPLLPIIAMSFDPRLDLAEKARALGASNFIKKPIVSAEELAIHVKGALESPFKAAPASPWHSFANARADIKARFPDGIVVSPQQAQFAETAARNPELVVCIYGETGTGKEELAKLIHRKRSQGGRAVPFVSLNCANLSGDLLLSTLFGHRRGAFTGATENTVGAIGQADGGILFLDEIHRLPMAAQEKLLRVLNDGSYQRVGDAKELRSSFQIIIASTRNLDEEVEQGQFLIDLRMRLIGLEIELAPLRERKQDLKDLILLFFAKQEKDIALSSLELEKLCNKCAQYYWQGNIRQLFKVLQTFIVVASMNGEDLKADLLPLFKTMLAPHEKMPSSGLAPQTLEGASGELMNETLQWVRRLQSEDISLEILTEKLEILAIHEAKRRHPTLGDAARALGLSRSALDMRRKKYSL